MCDPVTIAIIGGVASLAGTYITSQNNQQYADAVTRANKESADISAAMRDAERLRQQQYKERGQTDFNAALPKQGAEGFNAEAGTQGAAIQQSAADIAARYPVAVGALPGQVRMNQTVSDATDAIRGREAASAAQRVQAGFDLSGMAGAAGALTLERQKLNDILGLNNINAKRSAQIGEIEGKVPVAQVTKNESPWGAMLSGLGNLGLMYGMGNGAMSGLSGLIGGGGPSTAALMSAGSGPASGWGPIIVR